MSRGNKDGGGDGLFLFVIALVGFAVYGPVLAVALAASIDVTVATLAPYVGTVMAVVGMALAVKYYWSRW